MMAQKNFFYGIMVFILLVFKPGSASAQSDVWATAYYAGWMQGYNNNGHLPAQDIDYSAVTHIVHFALVPNSNGTLDTESNSITLANSTELLTRAHNAGKKVIISVGGWNSRNGFLGATNPVNLATFVANLVSFITTRGYDGVDIDWEPLQSSDATQYIALITALRTALDLIQPRPLLTAANGTEADIFAQIHQHFDQINLMTYDMSGAWSGWVTWHNSPVYNGGYHFPCCPGNYVPCANSNVDAFINAGIPASKIGIGIDFYGYVWSGGSGTTTGGATEPRQSWTTAPSVQGNVPYYTIMQDYYQPTRYHWDDVAKCSYLSIDNSGSVNDKFISYDEETTVQAKFDYARSKGIGGLIIWELGGGYRPNMPQGQRDLLLQAVKTALNGGGGNQDLIPPIISITSPLNGATVNGTITVSANASDNVGVVGVQFKLDGSPLGNEDPTSPYSVSCNTTQTTNGNHTLSATARDAAGNTTTASVTVNVQNTASGSNDLIIYSDALQSPWVNNSWNANINFNSTEKYYSGSKSIKTVLTRAWGALSMHYGNWGILGINTNQYQKLEFAVYATNLNTKLSIYLENDNGQTFPHINSITLPVNQWFVISIPMTQLNPNNQIINRISLQEIGGALKTFFVDELRFIGTGTPSIPQAPILTSPSNGATIISLNPTLSWNTSNGATSYRLQVSTNSSFTSTVVDQNGITSTSFSVNGLSQSSSYYWRVNASNGSGTSNWSTVFSFTTGLQQVTSGLVLYEESLVAPWINTSWSTSLTFNNTSPVYQGSYSTKVIQNGWGGFRLRSGSWGNPVNVNTSNFTSFEFAAYGGSSGIILGVYFENDQGQSFPTVGNIQVPANQWNVVSIPINQLNPNNRIVHSVVIQNFTSAQKTYYADNIRFMETTDGSMLSKETGNSENDGTPDVFSLEQNYPNPFNPSTTINFSIPEQSYVTLKIYNMLGEEITTLISGTLTAGNYNEIWNAGNLPSGIYIYQLRAGGSNVLIKKMNLVK